MPRETLSSTAIVRAAVLIADEQGLGALTMRHLSAHLGARAMALYRYVSGRDDLLDAMVAAAMDQLAPLLSPRTRPVPSAAAYLERTASDARDLALQHRWLIRLMVLRAPPYTWLSPPLSGLACTTSVLETLTFHGYDLYASVQTYRDFCAFLLGHLLMEIPLAGDNHTLRRRPDQVPPSLTDRPSQLVDHITVLAQPDPSSEFERSLRAFLRSVDYQRPCPASAARTIHFTRNPGVDQ